MEQGQIQHSATTVSPVHHCDLDSDDDDEDIATERTAEQESIYFEGSADNLHSTRMDEWILDCGVLTDHNLAHHGKTFVDQDGILRFKDNWQPAPPPLPSPTFKSIYTELNQTGCLHLPVCVRRQAVSSVESATSTLCNVSFLTNFRALWDYFDKDSIDELATFAPLFRMYVGLFFHQRTIQLMIVLGAYELFVHVLVDSLYFSVPLTIVLLNDFTILFEVIFYLALVMLFKGSIFRPDRPVVDRTDAPAAADGVASERADSSQHKEQRKYVLHWCASARQVLHHSWHEGNASFCRSRRGHSRKGLSTPATPAATTTIQRRVPFYDLLNITLKFLVKHSNNIGDKIQLNRRSHTAKLLFILCVLPIYYIFVTFVPSSAPYVLHQQICEEDRHSTECTNVRLLFYLSFGYATHILRRYIFGAAVLLSLLGLSFGAEVAHSLTDSWINRFAPLRRLAVPSPAEDNAPVSVSSTKASVGGSSNKSIGKSKSRASVVAPAQTGQASLRGPGPEQLLIHPTLQKSNNNNSIRSNISGSNSNNDAIEASFKPLNAAEVVPYLQRDAYEHYLFIREYMSIANRAWSPAILTFLFFTLFLIVTFFFLASFYAQYTHTIDWVYYTVWMTIRLYVLIVYPITALAHANAYVYALQEQFLVAAPEDFAVLGGRDGWLDYLDKVPAVWTVYGVTGLLWTGVASLGAIGISVASAYA